MTETQSKPHSLPEGWTWTTIGEISERIHYGYTAKSSKETIGPKMLRITDIQDRAVNWDSVPYCRIDEEKKPDYLLRDSDLVFARTGATVGKSFLIKGAIPEAVFASYLIRVIFPPQIRKKFVYYFFQSPSYWLQIFEGKIGIGQPNVNATKLSKLSIPLAPFPEQGRIVGKLEELFTRLDAGVDSLRNVKAQLQLYSQAVLNHAFNGKLTEEWRKTHKNTIQPATKLLEQIRQERKKKEKEKYREQPKIDTTNLPELPETWAWTTIIEIGEVVTGKTPQKNIPAYYSNTYPFFKPADLNSGFYVKASIDGLSDEGLKQSRLLPAKSTLVTCIGATIGKTGFIRVNGASNQQINAIIPCKNIVPEFVYFYCISPQFQKEIMNNYSSTTLPILNKSKFQKLHVALPSYLEQKRITEELESYFSTVDNIEKIVEKNLLRSERLRQSILKIAFEGTLVAQDPSDEPADVLLERIRQEKERQDNKEKGIRSRRKSRKRSQRRLNNYVE